MPHCQKENHSHASKSKKERQKAKQEAITRKQKIQEAKVTAEAEEAFKVSNNIALAEGHGEYEIGCEAEPEYHRYNVKKRSKKHLRIDLRKKMLREAQEEEERLQKEQEEAYKQQQLSLREASGEGDEEEEEEEEEPPVLEYFVFVCECCDKKYSTKNQFLNHIQSKKHKNLVRIYESLGLLVTHIELRGENGNEKESYDDYDEEDNKESSDNENENGNGSNCDDANTQPWNDGANSESSDDESEEESDDESIAKERNAFAALGFGSSSEDEESEDESDGSDNDHDDDKDDRKPPLASPARRKDPPPSIKEENEEKYDQENIDFDELIYQNQLDQAVIDAKNNANATGTIEELPPTPLPFHETYDPDDYGVNENRLVSVQHRLRKNLAAKGIESSSPSSSSYDALEAITMGKTLLQRVLEANIDTLEKKLAEYKKHKEQCELMSRQFALAKGNSKALPAQYVRKQDAADNSRRRSNVHHAGSHYHMQAARTMQFGRQKGLLARHSSQGARLQSSRMAAKETVRMQQGGGGMKIGKTSKKSGQKKKGEAGGSKKSGGKKAT